MGIVDAATRIVGLMGWPVSHSRSPAMHNAAFAALGLNWAYVPLPVPPDTVGDAVRGLRALGLRGANVTVPHKQAVLPFLDELTPAAAAIGSVNTIIVGEEGRLLGDNTDAAGFAADLAAHGVNISVAHVAVLGAGGSARAVLYALGLGGARSVLLLNRSPQKARDLLTEMQPRFPECTMRAEAFPAGIAAVRETDLVVNCTSLGMAPHAEGIPWDEAVGFRSGQVVYDLVYAPMRTRLLAFAEAQGARAIGGIGMLVFQGALAFEKWTGVPAPVEVMQQAALAHRSAQNP